MKKTLKEIADQLQLRVIGDEDVLISGVSGLKDAKQGDITFFHDPKLESLVKQTKASAIIVPPDFRIPISIPLLVAKNPSFVFNKLVSLFCPKEITSNKGIHPTAIIGKDVILGKQVNIGPYVVIEDGVKIGDRTTICTGVVIYYGSSIGSDTIIHSGVAIRENTKIGNRVIIHNGTVIGSDGFGYDTIDGKHYKIPQIGYVVIEDEVEIGANVTIDRARLDKTVIGKGTKIDNLVHIAHNVTIGQNCLILAGVGIGGSTNIGNNVTLAGQVGVVGHITIGDNVIAGGQSGITKSIPANTFVSGYPAQPHNIARRINAYIQKLPQLHNEIKVIKETLAKIKLNKISKDGKSKNNKKRNSG